MKRTYYTLKTELVPGWTLPRGPLAVRENMISGVCGVDRPDPARWEQQPHVAFANLKLDAAAVKTFTAAYGPLIADLSQLPEAGEQFEVHLTLVGYMQDQLRRAWRERDAKVLWFPMGAENVELYYMAMMWTGRGMTLAPADCWTYLQLLLTRDLDEKRARFCPNKTCKAPYFVGRTNQMFCSHKCASEESVRRWRKKQRRTR
jgi:hypothetical protein